MWISIESSLLKSCGVLMSGVSWRVVCLGSIGQMQSIWKCSARPFPRRDQDICLKSRCFSYICCGVERYLVPFNHELGSWVMDTSSVFFNFQLGMFWEILTRDVKTALQTLRFGSFQPPSFSGTACICNIVSFMLLKSLRSHFRTCGVLASILNSRILLLEISRLCCGTTGWRHPAVVSRILRPAHAWEGSPQERNPSLVHPSAIDLLYFIVVKIPH